MIARFYNQLPKLTTRVRFPSPAPGSNGALARQRNCARGMSGANCVILLIRSSFTVSAARLVDDWNKECFMRLNDPNQNHLLAALLDTDFDRIAPHLEPVMLRLGDVLYEPRSEERRVGK